MTPTAYVRVLPGVWVSHLELLADLAATVSQVHEIPYPSGIAYQLTSATLPC